MMGVIWKIMGVYLRIVDSLIAAYLKISMTRLKSWAGVSWLHLEELDTDPSHVCVDHVWHGYGKWIEESLLSSSLMMLPRDPRSEHLHHLFVIHKPWLSPRSCLRISLQVMFRFNECSEKKKRNAPCACRMSEVGFLKDISYTRGQICILATAVPLLDDTPSSTPIPAFLEISIAAFHNFGWPKLG